MSHRRRSDLRGSEQALVSNVVGNDGRREWLPYDQLVEPTLEAGALEGCGRLPVGWHLVDSSRSRLAGRKQEAATDHPPERPAIVIRRE
jgi:hypothetical protein